MKVNRNVSNRINSIYDMYTDRNEIFHFPQFQIFLLICQMFSIFKLDLNASSQIDAMQL